MSDILLDVKNLKLHFETEAGIVQAFLMELILILKEMKL